MSPATQKQLNVSWPGSDISWKSLDQIDEPGVYVSRGSGDMIRVPVSGASCGEAELTEKHTREPVYVTQISRDPFLPISNARIAAANLDIEISF